MGYEDFFYDGLVLQSHRVTMRLLAPDDIKQLRSIAQDPSLWEWFRFAMHERSGFDAFIQEAAGHRQQQQRFPFVVIDRLTNTVAGSTSLGSLSFHDRRVEIGWTWYGTAFRGTGINLHCKFLMLQYAFEKMHFERVEIKTDLLNLRSRKAIENLGLTQEGVFRSHMQMPNNRRRDSVYYSMLKAEWPQAKRLLEQRL
jgi:N-acetyltransferase